MTMLNDFLSTSTTWGVLLTLAAFALGTLINHKTGKAVFNPLLLGTVFVIVFLSVCGIPYASYHEVDTWPAGLPCRWSASRYPCAAAPRRSPPKGTGQ